MLGHQPRHNAAQVLARPLRRLGVGRKIVRYGQVMDDIAERQRALHGPGRKAFRRASKDRVGCGQRPAHARHDDVAGEPRGRGARDGGSVAAFTAGAEGGKVGASVEGMSDAEKAASALDSSSFFHSSICLGSRLNWAASSASVLSPRRAANATFALSFAARSRSSFRVIKPPATRSSRMRNAYDATHITLTIRLNDS